MSENLKTAYRFTSESVTEGYPDKICHQISDAISAAMLREALDSSGAIETTAADGLLHNYQKRKGGEAHE